MEKTFEKFKMYIVEEATKKIACSEQLHRAKSSTSFGELLTIIRENSWWCLNNNLISSEIMLEYVADNDLTQNGFYIQKHNVVLEDGKFIVWNSSVVAWGNSSVVATGNSSVEARGNSNVSFYSIPSVLKIHDRAIVRERSTDKVFMKKDAHEIIFLD